MRKANMTILASIIAIALVAMGVGAGSMAWFSSEASSEGNTFTAGTLTLTLEESGTSPIIYIDMAPGEYAEGTITLTNGGSLVGDLYGRCEYTLTDGGVGNTVDLAEALIVTEFRIAGQLVGSGMTLADFCSPYPEWDTYIPDLGPSASVPLYLKVQFDPNAGNDYQGDSVSLDIEFYLNQIGAPAPTP